MLFVLFFVLIPCTFSKWTFLVYMVADNNLEQYAIPLLQAMALVGSDSGLDIIVRIDRHDYYSQASILNLNNFYGAADIRVLKGSLQLIEYLGEIDTQDEIGFQTWVNWGVKTFPADNYGLIFWDHGSGWLGFGGDEKKSKKRISDSLTSRTLAVAIQNALNGTSLDKFDIIGFDACLMASLEVMRDFSLVADYFVASEETEPAPGWDYTFLYGISSRSPYYVGRKIVDFYLEKTIGRVGITLGRVGITLGVFNLSQVAAVVDSMKNFSTRFPVADFPLIKRVDMNINYIWASDKFLTVDFRDFLEKLLLFPLSSTSVELAQDLLTKIKNVILYFGIGYSHTPVFGISVFLPQTKEDLENLKYSYLEIVPDFAFWYNFWLNVLYTNTIPPAKIPALQKPVDYFFSRQTNSLRVVGNISYPNLLGYVEMTVGLLYNTGEVEFFGFYPARVYESQNSSEFGFAVGDCPGIIYGLCLVNNQSFSYSNCSYGYVFQVAKAGRGYNLQMPIQIFRASGKSSMEGIAEIQTQADLTVIMDSKYLTFYAHSESGTSEVILYPGDHLYHTKLKIPSTQSSDIEEFVDIPLTLDAFNSIVPVSISIFDSEKLSQAVASPAFSLPSPYSIYLSLCFLNEDGNLEGPGNGVLLSSDSASIFDNETSLELGNVIINSSNWAYTASYSYPYPNPNPPSTVSTALIIGIVVGISLLIVGIVVIIFACRHSTFYAGEYLKN